jgi:hypothetical protein
MLRQESRVMATNAPPPPNQAVYSYMPLRHVEAFKRAAGYFKVWILVRRGNRESLRWIGKDGYIPKLLDCKAKTADRDFTGKECAGLVVSPILMPEAFTPEKLHKALEEWPKFEPKLYIFDPKDPKKNLAEDSAGKHYTLQLDKGHKHYGCVMYKPVFRARAEYIHADYDIYAIVSADNPQSNRLVQEKGFGGADHSRGPQLQAVQYFVKAAGELKGAGSPHVPMIRHGEQETFKTDYGDPLDVFWPDGKTISELEKGEPIKRFYETTLRGRQQADGKTVLQQVYGKWKET